MYPAPPPPGYGYGYGYYYPPPPPKPRYPADAAASSTPFLDLVLVGAPWENRFSQFLNVGVQGGAFLGGRLRLTARLALPTETLNDEYYDGSSYPLRPVDSKSASFLYGASAGIVAVSTQSFVMSPGVAFGRSDVSDYGSMLALSMPFDWVMPTGMRVGLEADFGRAFGGRFGSIDCPSGSCAGSSNLQIRDRPAGTAFWLQFNMGFGFNHPAPLPLAPAAPALAPR